MLDDKFHQLLDSYFSECFSSILFLKGLLWHQSKAPLQFLLISFSLILAKIYQFDLVEIPLFETLFTFSNHPIGLSLLDPPPL